MKVIDSFDGEYKFLSNFYILETPIIVHPFAFITSEHAYQAAKTFDPLEKYDISVAELPSTAKKLGKTVTLRPDWEEVKIPIMEHILRKKFHNRELAYQLMNTGSAELIEGNWWHDTFWGVCEGIGENHLGKLLMKLRDEYRYGPKL